MLGLIRYDGDAPVHRGKSAGIRDEKSKKNQRIRWLIKIGRKEIEPSQPVHCADDGDGDSLFPPAFTGTSGYHILSIEDELQPGDSGKP